MAEKVNPLDPLQGVNQFDMLGTALQQAAQAQQQGLGQAIAGLQQSGAQDTAPQMDSPFPQGGLKGALFGIAAGLAGQVPQFAQQLQQTEAANVRQAGFLKLRQQQRDEKIAGLEAQRAGVSTDLALQQAELELRRATTEESQKIARENLKLRQQAAASSNKDTFKAWSSSRYSAAVDANLQMVLSGMGPEGEPLTPEQFEALQDETELAMSLGRVPDDIREQVLRVFSSRGEAYVAEAERLEEERRKAEPEFQRSLKSMEKILGFDEPRGPQDRTAAALERITQIIDAEIEGSAPPGFPAAFGGFGVLPGDVDVLSKVPSPLRMLSDPIPVAPPFIGKH